MKYTIDIKKIIILKTIFLLLSSASLFAYVNDAAVRVFSQAEKVVRGKRTNSDKYFVIVIASYKNKEWYDRNIASAISQNYNPQNFEVVFTDDCSPDDTGDLVEGFLQRANPPCKVTLIKNKQRCGALENIYRSIYSSRPDAVIVSLDGDDWFPNDEVLSTLNRVYSDPNVWITYGQFVQYPSNEIGWCTPMPDDIVQRNAYREYVHIPSHLRTFYAWLFCQINIEDLLHESKFFPMTWDMAFMLPMMEMAAGRFKFIAEPVYTYNCVNPISDHHISKELQRNLDLIIRAKKPYDPLEKSYVDQHIKYKKAKAHMIIHSMDSPLQLSALLESVDDHVKRLKKISVMYQAKSDEYEEAYRKVQKQFSGVHFVQYTHDVSFKQLLEQCILNSSTEYVLLTTDATIVVNNINVNRCIRVLEKTHAYAFYLSLDKNIGENVPPYAHIDDDIFAWQFGYAEHSWRYPDALDMVLYRKADIKDFFKRSKNSSSSLQKFKTFLSGGVDPHKVGLFYEDLKAVGITPDSYTKSELLQ